MTIDMVHPAAADARSAAGFKRRVREFFDRDGNWQGAVYDSGTDPHALGVRRRVSYVLGFLTSVPGFNAGTVLDVGCGPGEYLSRLSRLGFTCYGMDLSPGMLKSCRLRLSRETGVRLLGGDAERIPFRDGTLDLLLMIGVLQYLPSPGRALAEMSRVTREGGLAVVSFQNLLSLSNIDWMIRGRLARGRDRETGLRRAPGGRVLSMASSWFAHHPGGAHPYRLYNPWAVESLLAAAGFTRVGSMTYGYEFRLVRKLGLVPGAALDRLEGMMEQTFRGSRLPYLPYSGEYYVGIFRRGEAGDGRTGAGGSPGGALPCV